MGAFSSSLVDFSKSCSVDLFSVLMEHPERSTTLLLFWKTKISRMVLGTVRAGLWSNQRCWRQLNAGFDF